MSATKVVISINSCIPTQFTLLIIKRFIQFGRIVNKITNITPELSS